MTRNEKGIPQITFAPSAVYHRLGVSPMNRQRSWLPSPTRNAGVISASIRTKNATTSSRSRHRWRNAIESMNPNTATRAPPARLSQSDWRPEALTSSAIVLKRSVSQRVFHQSMLTGPRNGNVNWPRSPWKERIAIRIIGM